MFPGFKRAGVLFLSAFLSGSAIAGDAVYLKKGASLCDTYEAFQVESDECGAAGSPLGPSRSIRLHKTIRMHDAEAEPLAPVSQPGRQSVAVSVLFDFDSDRLSPISRQQLDKVAKVIGEASLLGVPVAIDGHADASGSESYNKVLSRKRAEAVRQYFVNEFGMDSGRFMVTGKGESQLFNSDNPLADENRRVEFTILQNR